MKLLLILCAVLFSFNAFSASIYKTKGLKALVNGGDFETGDEVVIDSDAGEIMATVVKVKGSKAVIKAESLGFEKGDDVSLSSGGSSSMSGGSGLSDMELTGSLGMNFGLEGTTPFVIAGDFKTKMGFAPNILFRGGLSFWSSETDVLFVKVNFTSILVHFGAEYLICLLYTSPSPRDS